ncbi:LysR family transcriptional regulator [Phosphitispora sp. TUW77]|uniref:LysR family transcriptional regulator n=1 Tax=Phosphitispora sp. TUW77 TaxID=3152361 RepID=UPI003AB77E4D
MDVNFELYKVFYYVSKDLSFSSASVKLYISQSAVSQSIKLLENKMNCRLFIRNTKQVKLTREGEMLFEYVSQAFNFIKAGERRVSELRSLESGEVRIGASDTICKHYLLPYFKKFISLYPNINIQVTNRTSPMCIELLNNGSVDVIVVNIPEKPDKNHEIKELKKIQDIFIAGNNFTHLKNKVVQLEELNHYPLLMLEKNTVTREFIDSYLKQKGITLTPEIELGSVDLLVELAKIGLGISFVVRDYIAKELSDGEIFALNIKEKIPPRSIGIITHKNIPTALAAQKLIQLFR